MKPIYTEDRQGKVVKVTRKAALCMLRRRRPFTIWRKKDKLTLWVGTACFVEHAAKIASHYPNAYILDASNKPVTAQFNPQTKRWESKKVGK